MKSNTIRIQTVEHLQSFEGIYHIRLCHRGIWRMIIIDDMLPATQSNTFVFTRCHKRQLFASFIEKALAKMYGSYDALESGNMDFDFD